MPGSIPVGETSPAVRANLERLRRARGLSFAELLPLVWAAGRPQLAHSGLHNMLSGKRRIDVDDLAALATALDASVLELLGRAESGALAEAYRAGWQACRQAAHWYRTRPDAAPVSSVITPSVSGLRPGPPNIDWGIAKPALARSNQLVPVAPVPEIRLVTSSRAPSAAAIGSSPRAQRAT